MLLQFFKRTFMDSHCTAMATRILLAPVVCLLLIGALGACVQSDPNESITVEISNVPDSAASEEILDTLKTMHDKDARYTRTRSSFNRGVLTVTLAPVVDVEAFTRRINFGTVTEISGRTVKVSYARSSGIIQI